MSYLLLFAFLFFLVSLFSFPLPCWPLFTVNPLLESKYGPEFVVIDLGLINTIFETH